ncbi:MAG: PIN domain-containing protein [Burkholderiales bacterium]|nr:PIN domain-containing protein [Burkholderiales bacterium]
MKLFLEANVVFSAAHRDEGRAQDLVALAHAGLCDLLVSAHALEEARRNLKLKSFGFERRLGKVLSQTTVVPEAPAPLVEWAQTQGLPLKDAPILAAAIHAQAELLVTGDARDFGHLYGRTLRGTRVATPVVALDLVLKSAGA